MLKLATILSNDWTPAEIQEPQELWGTDNILIADQLVIANALRLYCYRRLNLSSSSFVLMAARELGESANGQIQARFGVALLAIADDINQDQAKQIRTELAVLAHHIKDPTDIQTIGILETNSEAEKQTAAELRKEVIDILQATHGGAKIRKTLEINTDEADLIKLSGTLLERPDDPVVEQPSDFRGILALADFKKRWVVFESSDVAPKQRLYVSDTGIFEKIVLTGLKKDVMQIQTRILDPDSSRPRMEIIGCSAEPRNADPLSGYPE